MYRETQVGTGEWAGWQIDCYGPLLHQPAMGEERAYRQYGLGKCMQVSPTQCALLVNRRVTGRPVVDLEDGYDVMVFDALDQIREDRLEPLVRNHPGVHPRTGARLEIIQHLPQGGFVPLGATLADGRPHPHAGTGFGVGVAHGLPLDADPKGYHVSPDLHHYLVLQQYSFDGETFRITATQELMPDEFFPGHIVVNRALGPAIMDGEDLLFCMAMGRMGPEVEAHRERLAAMGRKPYNSAVEPIGECYQSGLSRWRRLEGRWRMVSFIPVPHGGPDMAFEPSLVRETDGSLLMTMRGRGSDADPGEPDAAGLVNFYEHIRVYRSTNGGETWETMIEAPETRAPTPVSINRLPDGTVFIAANPWQPMEYDEETGRPILKSKARRRLVFRQLSPDRRSLCDELVVLDTDATLGPPRDAPVDRGSNRWFVDHPIGGSYTLADGKTHDLVFIRVTDSATTGSGATAAEPSGCWLVELRRDG